MTLVRPYRGVMPRIAGDAFIAQGAVVIGDVEIGSEASVWYGSVLRGDVGYIRIGARSNIQDLSCIHMTTDLSHTVIGEEVTIGHGVIVHGARIEDGALIGMGAILMDNAVIGSEALVAAGALVPANMIVPPRSLVRGQPARVIRELDREEWEEGRRGAARYLELSRAHRD